MIYIMVEGGLVYDVLVDDDGPGQYVVLDGDVEGADETAVVNGNEVLDTVEHETSRAEDEGSLVLDVKRMLKGGG